jgi:hypothetical protein
MTSKQRRKGRQKTYKNTDRSKEKNSERLAVDNTT